MTQNNDDALREVFENAFPDCGDNQPIEWMRKVIVDLSFGYFKAGYEYAIEEHIEGLKSDLDDLIRVALTNKAGLDNYIMMNYPKEYAAQPPQESEQ